MTHIERACDLVLPSDQLPFVLEFGVAYGHTICSIKEKLEGKGYEIYGFDSFEGLPEDWEDKSHNRIVLPKGTFNLNGKMPEIDGVTLIKGWFEDTVPEFVKTTKDIALLHVDCDLYSSTKTVLYSLNNYIKPGTIIVFDEWYYLWSTEFTEHEQKCFYEWVRDCNRKFEFIEHVNDAETEPVAEQQIIRILN
jgi:hypothetical protein